MSWIANLLVLYGTWLLGGKSRRAFLYILGGEAIWTLVGLFRREWDIASICLVFTIMAGWNYLQWRKAEQP